MVDVAFLIDDSASMGANAQAIAQSLSYLTANLLANNSSLDFAFGLARFEDYGGASGFSGDRVDSRPFILVQPMLTPSLAGGVDSLLALLNSALTTSSPGTGGDDPEAIFEALYQIATGAGFDGDGNQSSLNSGPAGDPATINSPGSSGDVPPFASFTGIAAGSLGGIGWRQAATKLVILVTDGNAVAPFSSSQPIPAQVFATAGNAEPASVFSHNGVRFGFVSNAKSSLNNSVLNAVAPAGAATVQQTIDALNRAGIRVLGLAPGATATSITSPSASPNAMLSALARLTGALDNSGQPLVFDLNLPTDSLAASLSSAIIDLAIPKTDLNIVFVNAPAGLVQNVASAKLTGLLPGEIAQFIITLAPGSSLVPMPFTIEITATSESVPLATIPVTFEPPSAVVPTPDPPPEQQAPPAVTRIWRADSRLQSRYMIAFNQPLDLPRARLLANYRVVDRANRNVPIRALAYDPNTQIVTLRLARRLDAKSLFWVIVSGNSAHALQNADGIPLAGSGSAGTDFVATFRGRELIPAQKPPASAARQTTARRK
jgi:hypothetical protein